MSTDPSTGPIDSTLDVLDPDAQLTLADGARVSVRELTWKEAKRFLQTLAARTADFVRVDPATGRTDIDSDAMLRIITTDLGEELVVTATGRDAAWLEARPMGDFLRLLERAVALNLRPEMLNAGKAIAGRFTGLLRP